MNKVMVEDGQKNEATVSACFGDNGTLNYNCIIGENVKSRRYRSVVRGP